MSPDGSYLIFASTRPTDSGGKPLDGMWNGIDHPGKGGNLWRVNRQGSGWSVPVRLADEINFSSAVFSPAVAADGSIYFMAATGEGGKFQLYSSRLQNGAYQAAKPLAFSSGKFSDVDPTVAPDQSFIVFDSGKVKGGLGRLCIAFREGDHWSKPADLGDRLNQELPWGAHLDPDGRTIYFTGKSGIQKFSVQPWLAAHRK